MYGDSYECRDLQTELDQWRYHFVDVNSKSEQLMSVESRSHMLRDEVSRLQDTVKVL